MPSPAQGVQGRAWIPPFVFRPLLKPALGEENSRGRRQGQRGDKGKVSEAPKERLMKDRADRARAAGSGEGER